MESLISGIPVSFGGEEGYLDARFKHPLFEDEVIVGFRFGYGELDEPETFSPRQSAILEQFIADFSGFKSDFFEKARSNYLNNLTEFFIEEETEEMNRLLELPFFEFEQLFHNPFIKINFEDSITFGFYNCAFDEEHGCAVEISEGEITEISTAANLA
jgi:hypothetical protein